MVKHIKLDDETIIENWQSAEAWLNRHNLTYKIKRQVYKQDEIVKLPKGSIGVTVTYECAGLYDYRITWLEPLGVEVP